jgi:hypothetical protein
MGEAIAATDASQEDTSGGFFQKARGVPGKERGTGEKQSNEQMTKEDDSPTKQKDQACSNGDEERGRCEYIEKSCPLSFSESFVESEGRQANSTNHYSTEDTHDASIAPSVTNPLIGFLTITVVNLFGRNALKESK